MADIKALRSYLVSLGFEVNTSQFAKFEHALKDSAQLVKHNVNTIGGDILKWQLAITGMFASIGATVVLTANKVAMADQEYRLFGQQMFMDMQHAKTLKIALDALKQPLENIAFDPELHERFMQLQKDQTIMQRQLGGASFEQSMRQMRDIRFEFTRFHVEMQYFLMSTAQALFKALGLDSGDFLKTLQRINNYIIAHIPEWSRMFAQYIAPVMKDIWMIMKDVWAVAVDFATLFDNIIGMISGDSTVQGTANFDKFARSLGKVTHWLAMIMHYLTKIAGLITGAAVGGAVGTAIGGVAGLITGGPLGAIAGGATGGLIGTGIGGGAGWLFDMTRGTGGSESGGSGESAGGDVRSLAAQVGARLGVPGDVIYSQWAHETGNFTNRGATSLNNLAGIRLPGSTDYRSFGSLNDFGNYYTGLIQRRYSGALGAQSIESYATALKSGGYFEDSLSNYERGMHSRIGGYSTGGPTSSVVVGDINIMQPNATPQQIASIVVGKIQEHQAIQTSRQLAELTTVFG